MSHIRTSVTARTATSSRGGSRLFFNDALIFSATPGASPSAAQPADHAIRSSKVPDARVESTRILGSRRGIPGRSYPRTGTVPRGAARADRRVRPRHRRRTCVRAPSRRAAVIALSGPTKSAVGLREGHLQTRRLLSRVGLREHLDSLDAHQVGELARVEVVLIGHVSKRLLATAHGLELGDAYA